MLHSRHRSPPMARVTPTEIISYFWLGKTLQSAAQQNMIYGVTSIEQDSGFQTKVMTDHIWPFTVAETVPYADVPCRNNKHGIIQWKSFL